MLTQVGRSSIALQNDLGKCSGRATDGSPQASFGLWRTCSGHGTRAHGHMQTRCDMACVCDVNSFGGGPSWQPRPLPIVALAGCRSEERQQSSRPFGAAENFRGQLGWLDRQLTPYCQDPNPLHWIQAGNNPRPRQPRPRRLELRPGRISESLCLGLADRPPQPKLASCPATPHTTPHHTSTRSAVVGARDGQDDSIKGEQAITGRPLPSPSPCPRTHPSQQMRQVPGSRTKLTPPPSSSPV